MSAPVLLEQMTAVAAQSREEILAEARAEADRILAEARQQADERRTQALATTREAAEQMRARRLAQAKHQAEKEALTLRDRVVEDILNRARQQAQEMAQTPEFAHILKTLLAEVVREAPHEAVVEVPPAYTETCRRWLDEQGHRGLHVVADDRIRDGVAVRDQDRTFRVVNTLASRFERVLSQARRLCMHRLFEETPHAQS